MTDYPKRLAEIKESLSYDNCQTARTPLLAPCPFCGGEAFLQWGPVWDGGDVDCRVVCSSCHVATSRDTARRTEVAATGEDVTRLAAAEKAIARWNRRVCDGDE